jgi:hypothetical protein
MALRRKLSLVTGSNDVTDRGEGRGLTSADFGGEGAVHRKDGGTAGMSARDAVAAFDNGAGDGADGVGVAAWESVVD